jgi:hypothetical protein
MVATVIAAAGAFIGNAIAPGALGFLGLTGASAGWLAGSLLASAFAPTQRSVGPKLDDLKVSGSAYGAVLPYVEGRPRLGGQVVWASDKRPIENTQRSGGKGGGGSSVTTFTYDVDLLIVLTSVPCEALLKVFSGGDLVLNHTYGTDAQSVGASNTAPQWDRLTFYGGGPTQQPDPDYEAAVGADNALAYRGRASVFIKGLKLGQSGQLPNLTFEIARTAASLVDDGVTYEGVSKTYNTSPVYETNKNLVPWSDSAAPKFGEGSLASGAFIVDDPTGTGTYETQMLARARAQYPGNVAFKLAGWIKIPSYGERALFGLVNPDVSNGGDYNPTIHYGLAIDANGSIYPRLFTNAADFWYRAGFGVQSSFADPVDPGFPTPTAFSFYGVNTSLTSGLRYCTSNPAVVPLNTWTFVALVRHDKQFWTICGSTVHKHHFLDAFGAGGNHHAGVGMAGPGGGTYYPISNACNDYAEELFATASAGDPKLALTIGATFFGGSTYPQFDNVYMSIGFEGDFSPDTVKHEIDENTLFQYDFDAGDLWDPTYPSVAEVVERLCVDCADLPEAWVDVTDIESITTPVYALTVSQVSAPRVTIEMLMGCYFFEAFARGNVLHFRKRAGAAVATIPYEDLGWHAQGQSQPEAFGRVAGDSLPLPVQIALVYSDVNSDHQTDTQWSDRVQGAQGSIAVFQVPLGLTPSIAKIIADARLADMYAALRTAHIGLSLAYSRYEPTDVFIVESHDGSQFRMRSLKRVDSESVIDHDLVLDDATIFEQLGLTVGGTGAQTIVLPVPFTEMEILDIPLLRDADNSPGLYVATKGTTDQWRTADLFDSPDDVNYTYLQTVDAEATFGTCTTTLGDWTGGTVMDEMSHVTVNVDRGILSSTTYADMLLNLSVNMAVIGNELVQYRDATLIATGIYKLTGLLRGRRGTEWAMLDHTAGERFVALGTTGMRFLPLQVSDLNRERYYKAASAGQQLSAADEQAVTPVAINLEPFSPVGLAANRDDPAMTLLTWIRRTRLSTRVGGDNPPVIPLGEATEEYLLEIFDGTTIVRTETVTTPEFEYTDTMQIADFGSMQDPITFRVRQVSAIAGPGYPAEASV